MRIAMLETGAPLDMPAGRPADDPGLMATSDGVLVTIHGASAWAPLSDAGMETVRAAIAAADLPALHRIDVELAPLYCPRCDASYCRSHWTTWDVYDPDVPSWFEELRGRCPQDHERRIFD